MIYRGAFGGDLHKRPIDLSTIIGYVGCTELVQNDIINLKESQKLDFFVSLGDWYDKGYVTDISASLVDNDLDRKQAEVYNGNMYALIGNHVKLGMDSNPELHLIQPHPTLKSRRTVNRKEQIFKTPEYLNFNNVQISFMHWQFKAKGIQEYKPVRQPWAKYHIALFHTPDIIPNAQRITTAVGRNVFTNSDIGRVLEGVDFAIVGDIHQPIGQFSISTEYGNTIMVVPGSLTNTDSGLGSRHHKINMPIVTIFEDGTVKWEFLPLDLHTNMLEFKDTDLAGAKNKIKSLRGKAKPTLHEDIDVVASLSSEDTRCLSFNEYMLRNAYTDADKSIVRSVLHNPEDLDTIMKIFKEKDGVAL